MSVSLLRQILDGSLVSRQRLMQARHDYAPQAAATSPEQAFARWTERVAVRAEIASARELAGLSDAELSMLETEFVRAPLRRRTDPFRHAFRIAAGLAALGGFGLLVQLLASGLGDGGYRVLQVLSISCLLAAACVAVAGAYVAFSTLHLDLSHGTVGLFVGRLDDQHPWVYDSMAATRHPSAEAYRQQVLSDRGVLRGADFIVMREIVRAQEALERTQWARSVAENLQRHHARLDGNAEPRLVRIGPRSEPRTAAMP